MGLTVLICLESVELAVNLLVVIAQNQVGHTQVTLTVALSNIGLHTIGARPLVLTHDHGTFNIALVGLGSSEGGTLGNSHVGVNELGSASQHVAHHLRDHRHLGRTTYQDDLVDVGGTHLGSFQGLVEQQLGLHHKRHGGSLEFLTRNLDSLDALILECHDG